MEARDVFVSYSSKDDDFVRQLVRWLKEAGLSVWFAEETMRSGAGITAELVESIICCRHTIFVVSEHWLKSKWTTFECEVVFENRTEDRRIVPVDRMEITNRATVLGPNLYPLKSVTWLEDDTEPDARFWEICCGLTVQDADLGPREEWADRGRRLRGETARSEPIVVAPQEAPAHPVALQDQGDAHKVLSCNRDEQWGKLHRLTTDNQHDAILIPGPDCEAHELFLKRVETCLPRDPNRRICAVFWGVCPPQTSQMALAAIAEAIDCPPENLNKSLHSILSQQNLVMVHWPAFEDTDSRSMTEYYGKWLPELLDQVSPPDAPVAGNLKTFHAVRWPHSGVIGRGLAMLFSRRKYEKANAVKEMKKRLGKKSGQLRIRFLKDLSPITKQDIEGWVDCLDLDDNSRQHLVQYALDGETSKDILNRICERLGPQRVSV